MRKTDEAGGRQQEIYGLVNSRMKEAAKYADRMPDREIEERIRNGFDESFEDLETARMIAGERDGRGGWYGWIEEAIRSAAETAAWLRILQGRKDGTEAENKESDSAAERAGNQ